MITLSGGDAIEGFGGARVSAYNFPDSSALEY